MSSDVCLYERICGFYIYICVCVSMYLCMHGFMCNNWPEKTCVKNSIGGFGWMVCSCYQRGVLSYLTLDPSTCENNN